jgi:hypothetical protein
MDQGEIEVAEQQRERAVEESVVEDDGAREAVARVPLA